MVIKMQSSVKPVHLAKNSEYRFIYEGFDVVVDSKYSKDTWISLFKKHRSKLMIFLYREGSLAKVNWQMRQRVLNANCERAFEHETNQVLVGLRILTPQINDVWMFAENHLNPPLDFGVCAFFLNETDAHECARAMGFENPVTIYHIVEAVEIKGNSE
jgi:hypothetical protein